MNAFCNSFCRLLASSLIVFLFTTSSVLAQFDLLERYSFLNTTEYTFDSEGSSSRGSYVDHAEFGVFNESSMVGDLRGSQVSSIIDGVFDVEFFVEGGALPDAMTSTEATSGFYARFAVPFARMFFLEGTLSQNGPGEGSASLSLSGPETNLRFSTSPEQMLVEIDSMIELMPGIYTLDVLALSLGDFPNAFAGPRSADITLSATSLSAVPEPSTPSLLFCLASAGACWRHRSIR